MRIVFFVPPLRRPSGGLNNIYASAANLAALGHEVALCGPADDAPGFAKARQQGLCALPWGSPLKASDIWCIPEGWPNALPVGHQAGARTLLYVQNWVHMLDTLPQGVSWQQLPLEYVAVSRPVALFLEEVIGVKVLGIVPPALDEVFFQQEQAPDAGQRIRIAWMPRKNRAIGEQALRVCEMRLALQKKAPRPEWVSIDKMPLATVAQLLGNCHLFLSTGFPEGFALPPLEAMATGCIAVGCSGFGGWEYMRQARVDGFGLEHGPLLPPALAGLDRIIDNGLRAVSGSPDGMGNGFYTPDGDSLAAGLALAEAALLAATNSPDWQALRAAAKNTAARYTREKQRQAWAGLGIF